MHSLDSLWTEKIVVFRPGFTYIHNRVYYIHIYFVKLFYFYFMCVFCLRVCLCSVRPMSIMPEEVFRAYGTEIIDSCELQCGCLEPNPSASNLWVFSPSLYLWDRSRVAFTGFKFIISHERPCTFDPPASSRCWNAPSHPVYTALGMETRASNMLDVFDRILMLG